MKTAEDVTVHVIAARVAAAVASSVSFLGSLAKKATQPLRSKEWSKAVEAAEAVMKAAEEAPARKVAAAAAGVIAISIFFIEALFRAFG
ncbi:MAG: hypothetical protein WBS22_12185 [Methylocystis sp.]